MDFSQEGKGAFHKCASIRLYLKIQKADLSFVREGEFVTACALGTDTGEYPFLAFLD